MILIELIMNNCKSYNLLSLQGPYTSYRSVDLDSPVGDVNSLRFDGKYFVSTVVVNVQAHNSL